ncbi:MAG: hypothetical protein AAF620_20435 [Bacteroidota bacterium]
MSNTADDPDLQEGDTYIDDQFLAKDQNGTILNFGADGEVIELDGFVGDTEGLVEVETTDTDNSEKIQATGAVVVGGLVADDVTGVGVADDLAIPFAVVGFGIAALIDESTSETTYSFSKFKRGRSGDVEGAEHISGARKSTKSKHQKGQTRKQQVNRDKKRQKKNWKPRK